MNTNFKNLKGLVANLNVDNLDHNITITDSNELRDVNNFFSTITCGNKEIENLLYEVIGCSLTMGVATKLCKAFIFFGKGRNGKSKLFRVISSLLEPGQCSYEHLENLCGTKAGGKTTVNHLLNKCVNIAEDQKQPKYVNTSLITRIISGEPIAVGKDPITPCCTMLFSANDVIDFHETGLHVTDRICVIPFNATFTDSNNNRDINIEDKLCQEEALRIIATKS